MEEQGQPRDANESDTNRIIRQLKGHNSKHEKNNNDGRFQSANQDAGSPSPVEDANNEDQWHAEADGSEEEPWNGGCSGIVIIGGGIDCGKDQGKDNSYPYVQPGQV